MISRTKIENITSLTFNVINITLYVLITTAAVTKSIGGNFADIVVCVYTAVATTFLILNEIRSPAFVNEYFRFLCINQGRGLLFLFFGCVILDTISFNIIVGILSWTVGLLYLIISFAPDRFHPNALIVNWQTWKDFSAEGLDLANPATTPRLTKDQSSPYTPGYMFSSSSNRSYLHVDQIRSSPNVRNIERPIEATSMGRHQPYFGIDNTPDLSIIETMRSMSLNTK
ncbi:COPI associated protein-domain-containing protein [Umbelopsis sp. PMI_123]|nr:COPI associated protein-domain-containing protein [Umbelopsis sp. PMI_123]